jgi:Transglycosylase SLT domain
MHDSVHSSTRQDAVARRRRMHRRHAKRRLTKAFVVSLSVFLLAVLFRPDAPSRVTTSVSGSTITDASASQSAGELMLKQSAALTAQPIWRPAGEVLKRGKTSSSPILGFSSDTRSQERHESLNRWHRIYTYSSKYRIKPDLSRRIYDAATVAGLEPELAFRLVRVESVFDPQAVSPVGALGLTQLMLGTARQFEPNVTREELLTPDVNLRIGFKYLRGLIREYKGDLKLALLVYNRGPTAVGRALAMGQSPANGYESIVTKGYRGRGTLD